MDLAARTTASPAAIWVICAVAVVCLIFWLSMVMVVATRPTVRHRRVPNMPGPVLGGMHLAAGGRSVAPSRESPAVLGEDFLTDLAASRHQVPAQRGAQAPAGQVPAAGPAAEAPTEPIPAQRAGIGGTAAADTARSDAAGRT